MTNFYLIRHGEPKWDICEEYGLIGHGRDLVPLNDMGVKQAHGVSSDPLLENAQIILASPYTRALQTAAIISKKINIDIIVEFDLREWQPDLTFQYDSLEKLIRSRDEYEEYNGVHPKGRIPLWESKESVEKRVKGVLNRYLDLSEVIVVAHGMVFRTLLNEEDLPHCGMKMIKL